MFSFCFQCWFFFSVICCVRFLRFFELSILICCVIQCLFRSSSSVVLKFRNQNGRKRNVKEWKENSLWFDFVRLLQTLENRLLLPKLLLCSVLFSPAFNRENAKNGKFLSLLDIHIQCSCSCPRQYTIIFACFTRWNKTNENKKISVEQKRKLKNEPYTRKTNRTKKIRMKI